MFEVEVLDFRPTQHSSNIPIHMDEREFYPEFSMLFNKHLLLKGKLVIRARGKRFVGALHASFPALFSFWRALRVSFSFSKESFHSLH